MTAPVRDRPVVHLIRHFFGGLFDLGFLSQAGADALRRTIIGVLAAILAFGLLLVRLYMGKYAALAGRASPELYQRALAADDAFVLGLPMWVVAFVTVLVSRSLVPDEIDFRVLMPLPITRRLVFGAKLTALTLFVGLFTCATHVALAPLFLVMSVGPLATHALPARAATWAVAGVGASSFAVLAVTAVTSALTLGTPRAWLTTVSTAVRSILMGALALALPLVAALPAQAGRLAEASPLMYLAPPAWFLGVERVLAGEADPYFARLALVGATALALAALVTAGGYAALYRRFDHVLLRPPGGAPGWAADLSRRRWRRRRHLLPPARTAILAFTGATLRRSALHQGLLVGVSACGASLVLARLIASGAAGARDAVTWVPFALVFAACVAVKATLVVPVEERANWVFRITERHDTRADQLAAVTRTLRRLGVMLPLVALAPLVWWVTGTQAAIVLATAGICGLFFVELLLLDWRRIPFTASYIPGKRPVPRTILVGWLAFTTFTTVGAGLARTNLERPWGALVVGGVLLGITWALGRRRVSRWREYPLAFDDPPPDELLRLRLIPD